MVTFLAMVAMAAAASDSVPAPTSVHEAPAAIKTDSVTTAAAAPVSTDSAALPKPLVPATVPGPVGPVASPAYVVPVGPVGPVVSPGPVGPVGALVVPAPTATLSYGPTGAIVVIDTSAPKGKSTLSAVGLSLLLPGLGHTWAGYEGRAATYHALDLLGWAALFVSWQTGREAMSSLAEIANRYAGASLGSSPDPELISAIRTYRSRRPVSGRHGSYDENALLSGKSTTWQFADDDAHDWDWGSAENADNDSHLRAFESQYRRWRASQVALYASAGTIVLLRIVAAMDILRLERASAARAGITMDIGPQVGGVDARLAWKF